MKVFAHLFCILAAGTLWAEEIISPDGQVKATIELKDGQPSYSLFYQGQTVLLPSAAGLNLKKPFEGGFSFILQQQRRVENSWKQIWGERAEVPENYSAFTQILKEKGPRSREIGIEWRIYNEGLAFRYRMMAGEAWELADEVTTFRFPEGSAAWAIKNTEDTFPADPLPLPDLRETRMMPLTVSLTNGLYASVFEAFVVHYPRAKIFCRDGALRLALLGSVKGEAESPFLSPWRAVLVGEKPGDLIERAYLVLNLNPPCALSDTAWIKPGLTVSNEGSAPLKNPDLERIADVCHTNGFRYLQLDWGWYGTEWTWSDADRETFRKTNPAWANATDWASNTYANPYTAAKGRVPYRPDWKSFTEVNLDIPALVAFLKERGMGLCMYMHGDVLRGNDMDKLFATYEKWGLAGLKPGFVQYGTAEQTDWIRKMVATAAAHRLWLCVHDAYVPEGMERTYPNLMLVEGGGGQEGNHPIQQDVVMPFTRCLAGPFDYTPFIYAKGKSHAHGAAFFLLFPGPSAVMRGGAPAFSAQGAGRIGPEWEFVRRLPMNWDETRVVDAKIGHWLVTARRRGNVWFIAGMAGGEGRRTPCKLDFLPKGKTCQATLFVDGDKETDGFRPAVRQTREVRAGDSLDIWMAKGGGFVGFIE